MARAVVDNLFLGNFTSISQGCCGVNFNMAAVSPNRPFNSKQESVHSFNVTRCIFNPLQY